MDIKRSRILQKTFIESETVEQITDIEFKSSIEIDFQDCIVILFYNESVMSLDILKIFLEAADLTEGVKFGVVNLDVEDKILERFIDLNDEDHSHNWVKITDIPFILTYRKGYPQAFYNGEVSVRALQFYFNNLVHVKGYKEGRLNNMMVKKQGKDPSFYLKTRIKE